MAFSVGTAVLNVIVETLFGAPCRAPGQSTADDIDNQFLVRAAIASRLEELGDSSDQIGLVRQYLAPQRTL